MKKNKNGKRLITWIKTKGIVLIVMVGIVVTAYIMRWLVVVPYYTHSYLSVGHWGIIIGGFLMFILANIPVGIMTIIAKLDEDNLQIAETFMGFGSAIIVGITYLHIYMLSGI